MYPAQSSVIFGWILPHPHFLWSFSWSFSLVFPHFRHWSLFSISYSRKLFHLWATRNFRPALFRAKTMCRTAQISPQIQIKILSTVPQAPYQTSKPIHSACILRESANFYKKRTHHNRAGPRPGQLVYMSINMNIPEAPRSDRSAIMRSSLLADRRNRGGTQVINNGLTLQIKSKVRADV